MEVKDGIDLGVWVFLPSVYDGLTIHACMGPDCRGRAAVESARAAFKWVWENTKVRKIYAAIPNTHRHAQFLASWAGMRYAGTWYDHRGYIAENRG